MRIGVGVDELAHAARITGIAQTALGALEVVTEVAVDARTLADVAVHALVVAGQVLLSMTLGADQGLGVLELVAELIELAVGPDAPTGTVVARSTGGNFSGGRHSMVDSQLSFYPLPAMGPGKAGKGFSTFSSAIKVTSHELLNNIKGNHSSGIVHDRHLRLMTLDGNEFPVIDVA